MSHGWTTKDMRPQHGRRAIVTGANSGIGFYTALELARRGAAVVLASRNPGRGEAAAARIRRELPTADVTFSELDVASLRSVRDFAARELALGLPLDLLINNAGLFLVRREETEDGFERTLATNVLGHFALTGLLLPAMAPNPDRPNPDLPNPNRPNPDRPNPDRPASSPPRIVAVASVAHRSATLQFDDLQYRRSYSGGAVYSQTKLANVMLALELARRLQAHGSPIQSVAAHPGVAGTSIWQISQLPAPVRLLMRGVSGAINLVMNSSAEGAVPTLYAAVAPEAQSGGYYGPQGFNEARGGDAGPARIAPQAQDTAAAARLWSVCEELTGVKLL